MAVVPNRLARSRAFAVSASGIPNRSARFFRFSSSASNAASASVVSTGAGGDFAVVSEDGLGASRGCFGAVAGVVVVGCATFAGAGAGAAAGAGFVSGFADLTSIQKCCQGAYVPVAGVSQSYSSSGGAKSPKSSVAVGFVVSASVSRATRSSFFPDTGNERAVRSSLSSVTFNLE